MKSIRNFNNSTYSKKNLYVILTLKILHNLTSFVEKSLFSFSSFIYNHRSKFQLIRLFTKTTPIAFMFTSDVTQKAQFYFTRFSLATLLLETQLGAFSRQNFTRELPSCKIQSCLQKFHITVFRRRKNPLDDSQKNWNEGRASAAVAREFFSK